MLEHRLASRTASTPAPPPIVKSTTEFGRGRGFLARKAETTTDSPLAQTRTSVIFASSGKSLFVKPDTAPLPPMSIPQIELPPTPLALTTAENTNRATNSREWSPDDPFIQALATAIMRKL